MGADSSSAGHAPAAAAPDDVDALLDAARYGDMEDVTSLATAGVPLDSRDEQGRTALHMAAANGHLNIVDYLISKEASCSIDLRNPDKFSQVLDVNAANVEKNTPLHWACLNGHVQVVRSLILARANASLLNSHERTPIDEAVSRGKLDVVDAINAAAVQLELNGTSMS